MAVTSATQPIECLRAAECRLGFGGVYDHCGRDIPLSPLPMAEALCYQALRLRVGEHTPKTPGQRYVRAWQWLECSLANEDGLSSDSELGNAKEYLEATLQDPNLPMVHYIGARVLDAAWPLFASRQAEREPTEQELVATHVGFAELLRWTLNDRALAAEDTSIRTGAVLLATIGCLGNRERRPDRVLYPASLRESKLGGPNFATAHHQYYGIGRGHKVPVTAYTQKKAGAHDQHEIVKVNYETFVRTAVGRLRGTGSHASLSVALQRTPTILIAEALSGRLTETDTILLKALTGVLRSNIGTFAGFLEMRRLGLRRVRPASAADDTEQ